MQPSSSCVQLCWIWQALPEQLQEINKILTQRSLPEIEKYKQESWELFI